MEGRGRRGHHPSGRGRGGESRGSRGHSPSGRGRGGQSQGRGGGYFCDVVQAPFRGRGRGFSQEVQARSGEAPRRIFPTSLKRLQELLTKDERELVLTLQDTNFGFKLLLDQPYLTYDLISTIIFVLAIAVKCDCCPQSLLFLLNDALSSQLFTTHVPLYLATAPDDRSEMHLNRVHDVIEKLPAVFQSMLHRFPNKASEVLGIAVLTVRHVITLFETSAKPILSTTSAEFEKIEELRRETLGKFESDMRQKLSAAESAHAVPPPSDFRSMSIVPTEEDIHETLHPFLRANLVRGHYTDAEHYLDVHFRLLREDFVAPLRDGLTQYLALKNRGKANERHQRMDIKVYINVRMVSTEVSPNEGLMFKLSFDVTRLSRVNWHVSKRLMYGSLICVSNDNFRTFQLGIVVKRDAKLLEEGYVLVRFVGGQNARLIPNVVYILAESPAYFEAYSPILRCLQTLDTTTMPFKQYIIDAATKLGAPKYLLENSTYDFGPLTETPHVCRVLETDNDLGVGKWPSADDLKLDAAQYAALKTCLTKELAVIQGPPGTGKTFLGLKVVQMLLKNHQVWSTQLHLRQSPPILIVCYTNHALDQFLEGILRFQPTGLVRIGGRSKCAAIEPYSMASLRRIASEERGLPGFVYNNRKQLFWQLHTIEEDISDKMKVLKQSETRVLHADSLRSVMKAEHHFQLQYSRDQIQFRGHGSAIMNWLNLMMVEPETEEFDEVVPNEVRLQELPNEEELLEVEDVLAEEEMDRRIEDKYFDDDDELDLDYMGRRMGPRQLPEMRFVDVGPMVDAEGFQIQGNKKRMQKTVQRRMKETAMMTPVEADAVRNLWGLAYGDRWRLYRRWVANLRQAQMDVVRHLQEEYERTYLRLKEVLRELDVAIMSNAKVVGVTTTGAAKNMELLQIIGSKIVIVEEAAEVFEAHIITSLSAHCEHLILIGDQQQLRPNPTVYNLAREYNLDVSLFERLIGNGLPYERLRLQHRMRPRISKLLVPHIYKDLCDHSSVEDYPHVRGFVHDVFFVSHGHAETSVSDTSSRANGFEAGFLLAICRHLLLQGYEPQQITILATYLGQVFLIKQMQANTIAKDVHCTVVDNFQGEENDIILLSLVRSNADGSVGFLKVDNRVCVALSRAKIGLFCIGNFEFLAENARIWAKIVDSMKLDGLVGRKLQLRCDNHPNIITEVASAKDFNSIPEGGCSLPCDFRLPCGHQCQKMCHVYDQEHKTVKCLKPCERVLCELGHKCTRLCHLDCGKCWFVLPKVSPLCGHTNQVACHRSMETVFCNNPCEKTLRCGHRCTRKCGSPCVESDCEHPVPVQALCGHTVQAPCRIVNLEKELLSHCWEPCTVILPCEHPCNGNCHTCRQGRMHVRCNQKCGRTLVCGHLCDVPCAVNCPPCQKKCENYCIHSRCPLKCGFPCNPCKEPCAWRCEHLKCKMRCSEPCDRPPCNEACKMKLECGHDCIGFCGEPCPKECRVCDKDNVSEIFFGTEDEEDARFVTLTDCGHIVESSGMDYFLGQGKSAEESDEAIEMKRCPKCKTIIRRTLRYMSAVNQTLNDVIAVKQKLFGEVNRMKQMEFKLKKDGLALLKSILLEGDGMSRCVVQVANYIRQPGHLSQTMIQNLTNLLHLCSEMKREFYLSFAKKRCSPVTARLAELETFFMRLDKQSSEKEMYDFTREFQRIRCLSILLRDVDCTALNPKARTYYDKALFHLVDLSYFDEFLEHETNNLIKEMRKHETGLDVSEAEKIAIVQAMGLGQGHWFKCPKGHFYAIGNCGGAMQRSRCIECGAEVGGERHQLVSGNQLATEMDGAMSPAYPTALMR